MQHKQNHIQDAKQTLYFYAQQKANGIFHVVCIASGICLIFFGLYIHISLK